MKISRPFRIIAIYALLGSLWILISDRLVHYLWSNDLPPAYLQTVKGLLFILATSLLFYLLLRKYYRKIFAAEQGLQDQASRYQAAFDNSPGPLWEEDFSRVKAALDDLKCSGVDDLEAYLDAQPEFVAECLEKVRIVDVNQAAVDLHGAQNKSELLQSLSAIFPETSSPVLKAQFLEVSRGKTSLETHATVQTLDGRPLESIVRWSVLPGHEDNLDRVYVSVTDVTEQQRLTHELEESEQKYRTLIENASEAVLVVQDETIRFANPQWVKISGYSLNDNPGHLFSKLVHPDDRAHIESLIERLLAGQNIPKDVEFRIIGLQGSVLWVRANAVFLEWNGQPAAMALMTDITQQKRLQEKNREMEARMSQAQKMESIGVLAGGIAHDFNNLLSVILGFSRLTLEQLSEDDPGRENLEKVLAAGERASGLVNQILTFSRRKAEDKQPLQVNLALKETLKMLRSSVPAHIDIQQHIQTSSFVEMDITRLHQVIMNLCTNAYQSLPDSGGRIDITLSDHRLGPSEAKQFPELSPGDYICLQVSDNGPGMSSEVVQRIFDPYFTTKEVGRGTGLGLSVVHGIVQQAGGAIDVDSEPGQGTIFTVYLPIWQGERQTSEPSLNERQETNGNEHLLVVDDEPSVLKLLQVNLQTLGYRVSGLSKAREALETLRQNPSDFDALITDQAMPGITGRDLAKEVQAIRPDLPVILCTGKEEAWQDQGLLEGVIRAVLLKPFNKKELAQTVRRVLDEDQQAMDQKSEHGASTGPAHSKRSREP